MKVITGGRQAGKTTKLVEWAMAEEPGKPRYIVVATRQEADYLWEQYGSRKGSTGIRYPVTVGEIGRTRGSRNIYAIDNLDKFVGDLVDYTGRVEVVTVNSDELLETPLWKIAVLRLRDRIENVKEKLSRRG